MESSKMADGRLAILDILENKELFFKYVLGEDVKYYTNYNQKIVDEDIDDLKKPMTESERKLAELKAKVKAKNNQVKKVEVDYDKVEEKRKKSIDRLKEIIDFWLKRKYNIYGYQDKDKYCIAIEKEGYKISYSNADEQFIKNSTISATDIILFAEWIKVVNDDLIKFCSIQYGLK